MKPVEELKDSFSFFFYYFVVLNMLKIHLKKNVEVCTGVFITGGSGMNSGQTQQSSISLWKFVSCVSLLEPPAALSCTLCSLAAAPCSGPAAAKRRAGSSRPTLQLALSFIARPLWQRLAAKAEETR